MQEVDKDSIKYKVSKSEQPNEYLLSVSVPQEVDQDQVFHLVMTHPSSGEKTDLVISYSNYESALSGGQAWFNVFGEGSERHPTEKELPKPIDYFIYYGICLALIVYVLIKMFSQEFRRMVAPPTKRVAGEVSFEAGRAAAPRRFDQFNSNRREYFNQGRQADQPTQRSFSRSKDTWNLSLLGAPPQNLDSSRRYDSMIEDRLMFD